MTSLTKFQEMIVEQAKRKGWNNDNEWLFRKLLEEFLELQDAVMFLKKSQREIGLEGSDIIIVLAQIIQNNAPNVSMDLSLHQKIEENDVNKKKTLEGGKIVKK